MSIYTGGGDKGKTSLLSGERVSKIDPMVEAYGTLDELTAQLGVCRAYLAQDEACASFVNVIVEIQRELFRAGMQLSSVPSHWKKLSAPITMDDVKHLEKIVDILDEASGLPHFFVSPGRTLAGAAFHVARTVCRRAERRTITAAAGHPEYEFVLKYLNRLSDLLFSLSWAVETRILITRELSNGNQR